jgi:hypothetical protein
MPLSSSWILTLSACSSALFAQPSAGDVLKAAREALGGGKLAAIESLTVSGESVNGPLLTDLTLSIQLPDKFLREQTLTMMNGGVPGMQGMNPEAMAAIGRPTAVDGLNGEEQWSALRMSPDSQVDIASLGRGAQSQLDARQKDFKRTFTRFLLALLLADRPDFRVEFTYFSEMPEPEGGLADALDGAGPGDFKIRLFIDRTTHLPRMMAYPTGNNITQLWISKYKDEGGVLMPHLLSWMLNGNETERFDIRKVRLNPKFAANKFTKP